MKGEKGLPGAPGVRVSSFGSMQFDNKLKSKKE